MNTRTLLTAAVAGTAAAAYVSSRQALASSPASSRLVLTETLLLVGSLTALGFLVGGGQEEDGVGRGLLWAAGGVVAGCGIDKVLTRG